MENLEYLRKVKKHDMEYNNKVHGSVEKGLEAILKSEDGWEYRNIKAYEIIAEELIIFNKNFKSLIGGSVTHSIRTMPMVGG